LVYWLFRNGEQIDTYNSCPGYFSDGESEPDGGNSLGLCSAFDVMRKASDVEKTLHHSKYVFAFERHGALAELLGLPWKYAGKSYRGLQACLEDKRVAEAEQVNPDELIRIEPEKLSCAQEGASWKEVSLLELERETSQLPVLNWVGVDKRLHYFETREGGRYRVARGEWPLPPYMATMMPRPGDGVALFVTVKDGKITLPDPKKMTDMIDQGWLLPPEE
jgi:hypothetical protein